MVYRVAAATQANPTNWVIAVSPSQTRGCNRCRLAVAADMAAVGGGPRPATQVRQA